LGFRVQSYGMTRHCDLFTPRQLVALTTFSDLVGEARERVKADAIAAGMIDDGLSLNNGGTGATAYADAVSVYLGLNIGRLANRSSIICFWDNLGENIQQVFARQAIPMTWDFVEGNPFSNSTGNFLGQIDYLTKVVELNPSISKGTVRQQNAVDNDNNITGLISTDPPYYDAIGYADLSDFFYVWLRRALSSIYPNLFSTLLVPKAQELVATPHRFDGDKAKAQIFFEEGLGKAFAKMNEQVHLDYPLTVYYAVKQAESDKIITFDKEVFASTGWETMLEGLIKAGFSIGGTWPMRTELVTNLKKSISALASSIVLVCRPRGKDAPKVTRRQFLNELKSELPSALKLLQQGNIAPVDLAQASIGPGMAIFSKYTAVVEADGAHLKVRTALQLINQILDEFLSEQEGEFDSDTKWALTWFEQYQFEQGQFGEAETLSKAKNTSVQGMVGSGILEARSGKVRLLKRIELKLENNPKIPIWLISQHLIHVLDQQGEAKAAQILAELGSKADQTRELAYRLYSLCDRRGWTQESIAYNSLVISWPEISRLAALYKQNDKKQLNLL
jgi:putative DNA methylase